MKFGVDKGNHGVAKPDLASNIPFLTVRFQRMRLANHPLSCQPIKDSGMWLLFKQNETFEIWP
jgi:hypothetical protein